MGNGFAKSLLFFLCLAESAVSLVAKADVLPPNVACSPESAPCNNASVGRRYDISAANILPENARSPRMPTLHDTPPNRTNSARMSVRTCLAPGILATAPKRMALLEPERPPLFLRMRLGEKHEA